MFLYACFVYESITSDLTFNKQILNNQSKGVAEHGCSTFGIAKSVVVTNNKKLWDLWYLTFSGKRQKRNLTI